MVKLTVATVMRPVTTTTGIADADTEGVAERKLRWVIDEEVCE